uniref:Uncharacterized protein n=1 Tax=Sciurus vulgaris TaxID=55149 RepID=A0A8D2CQ79_SCIVU
MAPKPPPPPKPVVNQTPEEKAFYAPNHLCLIIFAILLFPPCGIAAFKMRQQTMEANKTSNWEVAYKKSRTAGWLAVLGIITGLGIIYGAALFL